MRVSIPLVALALAATSAVAAPVASPDPEPVLPKP